MTGTWADELSGADPDPKHEDFYLLVALKLGDPEQRTWIEDNAEAFYAMWQDWTEKKLDIDNAVVLIQYMLWYQRDRPKI